MTDNAQRDYLNGVSGGNVDSAAGVTGAIHKANMDRINSNNKPIPVVKSTKIYSGGTTVAPSSLPRRTASKNTPKLVNYCAIVLALISVLITFAGYTEGNSIEDSLLVAAILVALSFALPYITYHLLIFAYNLFKNALILLFQVSIVSFIFYVLYIISSSA